jgi:integrase
VALDGNPDTLWGHLQTKAPYTRATSWTRVCDFWDWLIANNHKEGNNEYTQFRRRNSRLFRNVYHRVHAKLSYDEAYTAIQRIDAGDIKEAAIQLLEAGLRVSELFNVKDNYVVGKGGRGRQVYNYRLSNARRISYSRLRRELQRVGLKPHDLRKICLTRLVDRGANEFELCAVAGWSSLNTAASYIRVKESRVKELMSNGK